jgi:phage tail-like protein
MSDFFQEGYTPPTAFYFSVNFIESPEMDCSFQEVSGLKLELDTMQKSEGGDNSFVHELPATPTYSNLILKRCLLMNSNLDKWCKNAIENFEFDPKDVRVSLLGANGGVLASWNITKAYPVSWELSSLNSTSNELAIETLELKYRQFKRTII